MNFALKCSVTGREKIPSLNLKWWLSFVLVLLSKVQKHAMLDIGNKRLLLKSLLDFDDITKLKTLN